MGLPHTTLKVKDYHEQTRYQLVRNVCWLIIILLSLITIQNLTNSSYVKLPNIVAIFSSIIGLIILKKTNSYKSVAIFLSLSSFTILTLTFFGVHNTLHYTTPLYMIMNILFTFFTLKHGWGFAILAAHFIGMIFYFYFRLVPNLAGLEPYDGQDILTFSTEYSICGAGIGYIIYLFIKTSNYAETSMKMKNKELNEKNIIIGQQYDQLAILLKEIHHRIKNNLQVVTSLLRLQSYEIEDPKQVSSFNEAINRVNTMSLIHERMYQNNLLTTFDFKSYIQSLANELISAYSFTSKIDLTVNSDLSEIETKNIVPISLLFNELISNSIKHAFTDIKKPEISIEIKQNPNTGSHTIVYQDNGTWKESLKKSFGSELIITMSEQLDGSFTINTEAGTRYDFTFNNLSE